MADDYNHGKEIGSLEAKMEAYHESLRRYIRNQEKTNEALEKRVRIMEGWIQTTTGRFTVMTALFGVVGTGIYIFINWAIEHIKFK